MKRSSAKPDPGEPLLLVSAAAVSPFPCGHEEKPTPSLCGQLGQHAGRSLALVLLWSAVMTQAGLESRRQGRWPSVVTTGNRTTQTIRGHWTLSPNWRDCATWVGHISGQTELAFVAYLCSLSLSLSRSYPHSCHCFCSECIECTSFRFFWCFYVCTDDVSLFCNYYTDRTYWKLHVRIDIFNVLLLISSEIFLLVPQPRLFPAAAISSSFPIRQ